MAKEKDRIQSFSIRPDDGNSWNELQKLKAYSKLKGISFSFLVIKAITLYNKELQPNGK